MKALLIFFLFLSQNALSQSSQLQTAVRYMQNHDYKTAQKLLLQSLQDKPHDELSLFNLGICQYQLKDFKGAADSFDQVSLLRGGYESAAHYYGALANLNLGLNANALKKARAVSRQSELYPQAEDLIRSLQQQSDEFLRLAEKAYAEYEDEQCLSYLNQSIWSDHPKGVQLRKKCQDELDEEQKSAADALFKQGTDELQQPLQDTKNKKSPHDLYLFADLSLGYDNNIYTVENTPTGRPLSEAVLGFEYLYKTQFDIGLGASYDYNNVIGVTNYQDSYINAYVPLNFYFENSDLHTEIYTNITQANSETSYTQYGLNLSYIYDLSDFSLKFVTDQSQKKSVDAAYDYVNGHYSIYKLEGIYENESFKFSLMAAYNINQSEDLVLTGGTLPFAYRSTDAGLFLAYKNQMGRLSLYTQLSHRNYLNDYAGFKRQDDASTVRLRYDFKISSQSKIYFEDELYSNKSNYDQNQILNKNFTENISRIGVYISR